MLEDPDGASGFSPVATLPADSESHDLLVFLPAKVNARYVLEACNDGGCGTSEPVEVGPELVEAIGYVKASNTGANDTFGWSLALSADGATLAVGAPNEDSSATEVGGDQTNDGLVNSGAVYVFTRTVDGGWSQDAYLKAWNTGAGDLFGWTVELSADGGTLAVGAPGEDSGATGINSHLNGFVFADNAISSGAVYVFSRADAGAWAQEAYVKAPNTDGGDSFGYAIALSADGATLAVGAYEEDGGASGIGGDQGSNTAIQAGAVYVFARTDAGLWSDQAYVKASNTDAGDNFGFSVTLSGNGATLVVGAIGEASAATGIGEDQNDDSLQRSGAAYVFTRTATGVWSQQAYVKASNSDEGDVFGVSLDVSADGSTLAVGAIGEASAAKGVGGDQSDDSAARAGAVYVFARSSVGVWSQDAYLKASNASADDEFGWQVALAADGGTLAISAKGERSFATGVNGDQDDVNAFNAGAVFVVDRTPDDWLQTAYVKASNTGQGDEFGYSVGLSADGDTLAVGAIGEASQATGIGGDQNDGSVIGAGAVYLY